MRIVTNPGSNLTADEVRRCDVFLTGQKIVVDQVQHDTRDGVTLPMIDEWVQSAKVHPYVLGSSATDFLEIFRELGKTEQEVLVLSTSRKIVGSHTGALSAAKAIGQTAGFDKLRIAVVDTKTTDLGAGMAVLLAAEARAAKLPMAKIVDLLERAAEQTRMVLSVETLDALVKGGRASFLRSWMAGVLSKTPLIGFVDGELRSIATVSTKGDVIAAVADRIVADVGERRAVWCSVVHGQDEPKARRLVKLLQSRLQVRLLLVRPVQSSIYLNIGKGSVAAFVCPVDDLPWFPTTPA